MYVCMYACIRVCMYIDRNQVIKSYTQRMRKRKNMNLQQNKARLTCSNQM